MGALKVVAIMGRLAPGVGPLIGPIAGAVAGALRGANNER